MSSSYFGLVELVLVFGLAIAFYFWQMSSLKRDVKAREEREARERSSLSPPAAGHSEGKHELDDA